MLMVCCGNAVSRLAGELSYGVVVDENSFVIGTSKCIEY